MNAPVLPTVQKAQARRLAVLPQDADFLPAAIEILETPPSPVRMAFLVTICAFVALALLWSYIGTIDIIASARGKIQPAGRTRIIQPVEAGRVAGIPVRDGQYVREGDIVLALDASDAQADVSAAFAGLNAFRSEMLRRKAALEAAMRSDLSVTPIVWPADLPLANRAREDRVLGGDVAQLAAAVASLDAQIRQKDAERRRLQATIDAQKDLVEVLQQRVDLRSKLVTSGAGPLTAVIDAKENLNYHTANYATARGQLEESVASGDVLRKERAKAIDGFIADNYQKLAEAERQAEDYEQRLAKAQVRLSHMAVGSPIAGTVASTVITAVGQVVSAGEEVVRIVPAQGPLEIEAYLENKDIGFVKVGQHAQIKIESFPFTRYGTISADVVRVAKDSIPEQDASQIEGDPAKAVKSSGLAGGQRTQNLVFPISLRPDATVIQAGAAAVPLSPGMAVTIEVATGRRRILEYFFSPLVEIGAQAFRER